MAIYETVVILDSLLAPKEIDDAVERISSIITDNGGTIRSVDKQGKRRLAYEIQKKQYGFYVFIEFDAPEASNLPIVLQAEYNFNDNVLRYLTYKYDKHKLAAMAKQQEKAPSAAKLANDAAEKPEAKEEPKVKEEEPAKEEPKEEEKPEAAEAEEAEKTEEKPEAEEASEKKE